MLRRLGTGKAPVSRVARARFSSGVWSTWTSTAIFQFPAQAATMLSLLVA